MATILVIDDDPDVSDAVAMVLTDEGYRVITASNGKEGLECLRRGEEPSLILLDLMMPVMDGYQFRLAQRQDPALASIPVVVLTAGTIDRRVGEMAPAAFLKKPVTLETLVAAVAQHRVQGEQQA